MKKNILLLSILIGLLFTFNLSIYGQKQRLGIKPQQINLRDGAPTAVIEAYCFDRHVFIDKAYNYGNLQTNAAGVVVTAKGKNYTVAQAVKNKIIEITGRPGVEAKNEAVLVIEIKKLVAGNVLVNVKQTSVFRNTPGSYSTQKALTTLATKTGTYDEIQNKVWFDDVDRMRLETLGYKSIRVFQTKNKLTRTGTFNKQTKDALEAEEAALIKKFADAGVQGKRTDTPVQSLSDYVNIVQDVNNREQTGVFSADLLPLLENFKIDHRPISRDLAVAYQKSRSYIFRIESLTGKREAYEVHHPYGVFRTSDTKLVAEYVSGYSKIADAVYLELKFPSREKIDAFKASINTGTEIYIEATPAARNKFFSTGIVDAVTSESSTVKAGNEFSKTVKFKARLLEGEQKMTIRAKIKETVATFADRFKSFVSGNRTLPTVVAEAKKTLGPLTLEFDEINQIEIFELRRPKTGVIAVK
jgi:hypothetical protein